MSKDANYLRVAKAIEYISQNFKQQPSLSDIAEHIHLSQTHFQRIFSEWAGISPKKFLQYISLEHAKSILKHEQENSVFNATFDTGFSSTSRLHDLFIKIEGMSPAEYKNGGEALDINYNFSETLFGSVMIASTAKGICYMAFIDDEDSTVTLLKEQFPNAKFTQQTDKLQSQALTVFNNKHDLSAIKLHLKGSAFQLKVWQSLLKIPMGQLTTYGAIAKNIDNLNASRAVGNAIGRNPVAFLIPCHRVIQSSGHVGGYMWGTTRKTAMIAWEGAQTDVTE